MPWTRRRFVAQAAAATFLGLPAGFRRRSAYAAGPAGPRSPLRKIHLDDARAFGEVKHLFANDYPGMKLSLIEVDGQRALGADHGGMKVFWVYGGAGVVFLPEGYRTQEGGSQPLPAEYKTESIDPAFAGLLRRLKAGISSVSARAAGHVEAILGVNYHADEWRRAIATSRLLSIAFIAVLLVILVASSVTSALYHAQLNENQRARQARTQSEALLHATINSSQDAIITTDSAGVILTFNPAAEAMFGRTAEEMVGQKFSTLLPPEQRRGYDELLSLYLATKTPLGTISRLLELSAARRGGELFPIEVSLSAGEAAGQHFVTAVIRDITHRKQIEEELATHRQQLEHLVAKHSERLLAAQRQLLHNEKLASVGQLAAGVAHEINTPIQYVGDNLRALSESFDDLLNIQNKYRELVTLVKTGLPTEETISAIEAAASECDLDFLIEDTPKAIAQGLEGVARVTHIVRAMKDFSHVDRGEVSAVDINHALESTLTVARNEYKYVADIETDFGQLPPVECFASEMNQVFLNVLVNAAQAIAETGRRGTITLRTRHIADQVEVTIHDTGAGIPEAVRAKVFDPFYTTKAVGKGSGQGLNIAHQIVVRRHGGTIDFDTETGTGTTFVIRIPVRMPAGAESRQGDV